MKEIGVTRVVYTDVSRDGLLRGINIEETARLAQEAGIRVIASGGAAGETDVRALWERRSSGVEGVILGRSLNLSITKDVDALAAKIKELVQVTDGDDTKVTKVGGGKLLLVEVPMARLEAAATYDAAQTAVAAAATQPSSTTTRSTCSTGLS
jgi:methyl-coenzyme M reductase beta subunit